MENHENNGHGNSHDDSQTEGNRQYYPKGWYLPLVGLFVVAFGFALLGGFIFGISGTDKWGKTEQCENTDKCCADENCKGECKDKKGEMVAPPVESKPVVVDTMKKDSVTAKVDGGKTDSVAKPANH